MQTSQRIIKGGGLCGVLGIALYLGLAISDPYIGPETKTTQDFLAAWGTPKYIGVNMALHFLFAGAAILWVIAFGGLYRLLSAEDQVC